MLMLANGFAARGYPVDLVLARAEGPYLKDVANDVRIVNLGASRVSTSLPGLVRYLHRERPRALLSAMSHANVVAVSARELTTVPTRVVVSEHANFSASKANATSGRGRSMEHFMRWLYPRADGVVAVSAGVADDLARSIELPRERIAVVYNPVVSDAMTSLSETVPLHPWVADGKVPIVLAVGRLVVQKDFGTLVRAFAAVRKLCEARLLILGEGPLRPQLEAMVEQLGLQDAVSLPGFVDNPFAFMRRADLFVLSSAWEGLGNVLIEAMVCGTPVVSTDCPSGPAEILEGGRWGRLVPVGDVDALATAMIETLNSKEHPDVAARA
jgi:glycosyltransferase involved in cell wall biosynthesis